MLAFCAGCSQLAPEGLDTAGKTPQQKLLEGNRRYAFSILSHPNQSALRRMEVAKGQHPFATIVTCSDSRVPPEIIFDQGLGDLFVIRLAGNIIDDTALGSLEYAVEHLNVKYIMVLGHKRCGAVDATIKGDEAYGHVESIVKAIQPSVDKAKNQPGDLLDNAIRANVSSMVRLLKSSQPILEKKAKEGGLSIVGAYYDLDDGTVTIIP
ncbi:MAG TPA: carbonic anhydrase [Lentisphaeria bacterium]|nr:carbonic anhydrase [Lentisphaeria bacterium]